MSSGSGGYGGKVGPPATTIRKPLVDTIFNWQDSARCLYPAYEDVDFFPHMDEPVKIEEAKRVCRGCPVRDRCREFAVANEIEYGIWGGETWAERVAGERSHIPGGGVSSRSDSGGP